MDRYLMSCHIIYIKIDRYTVGTHTPIKNYNKLMIKVKWLFYINRYRTEN